MTGWLCSLLRRRAGKGRSQTGSLEIQMYASFSAQNGDLQESETDGINRLCQCNWNVSVKSTYNSFSKWKEYMKEGKKLQFCKSQVGVGHGQLESQQWSTVHKWYDNKHSQIIMHLQNT